ncbi:MAG: TrmH family RNA methyltransferase [Actinomycetota bacterium]
MPVTTTPITDAGDQRLADFVGLTDPEMSRRSVERPFFIAEGIEVVRRLVASGLELRSIVVAPNRLERLLPTLTDVRCPIYVAERDVISATVGYALHRGVIGSAYRPVAPLLDDVLSRPPLDGARHRLAVLQGVNDHENLGAIARSARAFAIDALVLDPTCADPYYRRCVRVSMGEILFLPVITTSIDDLISTVHDHHGTVVALTPRRDAETLLEVAPGVGPLALVLGAEGFGLPDSTLSAADHMARIPIAEDVDSLNVGHAAAVAFALTSRDVAPKTTRPKMTR